VDGSSFAATRPDTFRVQRALRVNAPPDKIFALIVGFHRWGAGRRGRSWTPHGDRRSLRALARQDQAEFRQAVRYFETGLANLKTATEG
jgi:hypothetical protein